MNRMKKTLVSRSLSLAVANLAITSLVLANLLFTSHLVADDAVTADSSAAETETGFVSLFDGHSFDGWKKAEENPEAWVIEDGKLVCKGKRCHLFYVGEQAPFKNFHFKAEVMTTPGSNAGIYFHTKYQPTGWPKYGYECQVNVSHRDPKKTSSLYSVQDVADPGVKDNQWYTQEIIVKGRHIELKVNGRTMVDYTEPEDKAAFSGDFERRLNDAGTFALQAHDPESVVYFRNLRVKKLDD
ncbi:DUF1080 domain-containing protein [Novipirellula caenicola]|uniref:3-keto-alpha-glucoside-1,2-lyase/3-keto-2-hydroxy-glucal hydratase domain-containing protein n=1 Tax=Novipirellula caenicola TaxID=1536901 RepID=A0ABP9VTD9_9BACT